MLRKPILVAIASLVLSGLSSSPGSALDRASQAIVITPPDKNSQKEQYPPLVGNDPGSLAFDGGALTNPEDCKLVTSCDSIPLVLNVPKTGIYRLSITMDFTVQEVRGEKTPDIDLYVWEEQITDHKHSDGTMHEHHTFLIIGRGATADAPEVAKVADLPPTSRTQKYWLTPVLWAGANHDGYSIYVEYANQTIKRRTNTSAARPKFTLEPPDKEGEKPAIVAVEPTPSMSPVKLPGADGPLQDHGLFAVKGQATSGNKGPSKAPIVAGTGSLLALWAVFFTFFFFRARRSLLR